MAKQTALIVCPGRGTYNAAELGYYYKHHPDKLEFLASLDEIRAQQKQVSITDLDTASAFKSNLHGTGDNASLLIYACAMADYMAISKEKYDIVAITGNSMGWYLALAASGALSLTEGAHLVNTMGTLMHAHGKGGQIVYSVVDDNWKIDQYKLNIINDVIEYSKATTDVKIYISIRLGGMVVFAANDKGLSYLNANLPKDEHFPLHLRGHNGFHSPILDHMLSKAQKTLPPSLFRTPNIPLIDGQGNIWTPHSTDTQSLYDYTLGEQLNTAYDFSSAIDVGIKEFAPDKIIVLGPGTTMGAPVAQVLIENSWLGITDKGSFKSVQKTNPFLISMGMDEQRKFAF